MHAKLLLSQESFSLLKKPMICGVALTFGSCAELEDS